MSATVVGLREQRVRRFQAQRPGGREVEHELELGRLQDRHVRYTPDTWQTATGQRNHSALMPAVDKRPPFVDL